MLKIPVHNIKGEQVKEAEVSPAIFGIKMNTDVIEQVFRALRANVRQVLAHTLTKGEVRGGGRKPWKQKGTGRARQGSIRNPQWRGGGIVFGPRKDRNFTLKINKKQKRKALFMVLSEKFNNKKITILDNLKLEDFKTKDMLQIFCNLKLRDKKVKNVKAKDSLLIVLPTTNEKITKSINNLSKVKTIRADSLNIIDILKYQNLLFLEDSLDVMKKTYLSE